MHWDDDIKDAHAAQRAFEVWASKPPFELDLSQMPQHSAWPGVYRDPKVQVAFEAYRAGLAESRDREERLAACRAAIDDLTEQMPQLVGRVCGATTLGNLRASLGKHRANPDPRELQLF